ncbi:MAG: hypothetical protein RIS70_1095 [Planctomycetota bacterium]|jgi:ELWxxDGT repeat protein
MGCSSDEVGESPSDQYIERTILFDGSFIPSNSFGFESRPARMSANGKSETAFWGKNLAFGDEIWITDGTVAGTRRVTDINPGPASSRRAQDYSNIYEIGGNLYFMAENDTESGLWEYQSATNQTRFLSRAYPGIFSNRFYLANEQVWFDNDDSIHGTEPWLYDPFPWRNHADAIDVSFDGSVTALDAVLVINELNQNGGHKLPPRDLMSGAPWVLLDVSGDDWVTPLDAVLVVNELNARTRLSAGEAGDQIEYGGQAAPITYLIDELLGTEYVSGPRRRRTPKALSGY